MLSINSTAYPKCYQLTILSNNCVFMLVVSIVSYNLCDYRDRLTEDDTVGVYFLPLSMISASRDNGELLIPFMHCMMYSSFNI